MRATAALLASLLGLSACHLWRPDHSDPKGLPPPSREEVTWESFFPVPWPDPLHEKYEELFLAPFPNRSSQHFAVTRPFSDVRKYDLAFHGVAVPGARTEVESAGGEHAVSLLLPGSAGKDVAVRANERSVLVSVAPRLPPHRYRAYRVEETVVPLPPGADPETARVARDGDWVRVRFNSKDQGRPNGK